MTRRHLKRSEAELALRSGRVIEQFLGLDDPVDGRPTLTYVWLSGTRGFTGRVERVYDDGRPDYLDITGFGEVVDPEIEDWDPLSGPPPDDVQRRFDSAAEALEWAHCSAGASTDRWTNSGLLDVDYATAKGWSVRGAR